MSYPTEAQFTAYCSALGFTPAVTGFINSAIQTWERLTGYVPFVASSSGVAYFDPPGSPSRLHSRHGGGRVLELDTGYTEITSIKLGVTQSSPGTEVNLDYVYFLPINNEQKGLPIDALEFASPIYGPPRSIEITGTRGYTTTLPADVFQAILQLAAGEYIVTYLSSFTGGVESVREADVAISYGSGSSASSYPGIAKQLKEQGMRTAYRYMRMALGL